MELEKKVENSVFVYDENFWTGKRKLTIDGAEATTVNRSTFNAPVQGTLHVKGSYIFGVSLVKDDGGKIVLYKNTWWEWVLIVLPLIGIGVGVFCGAVFGGLSALFGLAGACGNASILHSKLNTALKITIGILIAIVAFCAWFGIYVAVVGGIMNALKR